MDHVNTQTKNSWNTNTTKARLRYMLKMFNATKQSVEHADFRVTELDRARGITNEQQKRNAMFYFYDRLDALVSTSGIAASVAVASSDSSRLQSDAPSTRATPRRKKTHAHVVDTSDSDNPKRDAPSTRTLGSQSCQGTRTGYISAISTTN